MSVLLNTGIHTSVHTRIQHVFTKDRIQRSTVKTVENGYGYVAVLDRYGIGTGMVTWPDITQKASVIMAYS